MKDKLLILTSNRFETETDHVSGWQGLGFLQ